MVQERRIGFRAEERLHKNIKALSKKLGVGASEVIRLGIDELFAKYVRPGYRGQLMVVVTEQFNRLTMAFQARIAELDPKLKAQAKAAKEAELGKKVHQLYAQGKRKEAKELVEKSYKEGFIPWYFEWEKS